MFEPDTDQTASLTAVHTLDTHCRIWPLASGRMKLEPEQAPPTAAEVAGDWNCARAARGGKSNTAMTIKTTDKKRRCGKSQLRRDVTPINVRKEVVTPRGQASSIPAVSMPRRTGR